MKIILDVQNDPQFETLPSQNQLLTWVRMALSLLPSACLKKIKKTLTIRFVDSTESAFLNETYRGKIGPTNVLSFSENPMPGMPLLLGELVICVPLVIQEANNQHLSHSAHFAHLIVHGVLHLVGYDHETTDEAVQMEHLESQILKKLKFQDPYAEDTESEKGS